MDDLHAARGILARTADKYRKAYGAEHSFLSVGGSTAAIEAMLLSLDRSERLLVCRDCHRSVIGGAILSGIWTEFFTTPFDDTFGAPSLPDAALVERELCRTGATAIFITSPNVYGFTADLPAIADVCRKHGALLLVDAAHGAHFPFSEKLPATPAGEADLWCHSQHKTMNALTQAATLHLSDCRIAPETVQRRLALIETSSPSYLLLASLDWALYTAQRQDWNAHAAHMAAYAKVIGGMAGLSEVTGRLIRNLSKGYRQRVGVAQALCGDPPVIVLDEPTVGLDPRQIREFRDLLSDLSKEHTIILSSHILSEVQEVGLAWHGEAPLGRECLEEL